MTAGFGHLGDRLVHQGYIWHVVVADFEAPDGHRFTRDVVRSPGAVGIVPVVFDPEGLASVVLVRQYRPAHDRPVLEIPAGMRDVPGEPPEETARRELVEEVGLAATRLDHLTTIFPSPGMTDARLEIYLATEPTPVERSTHGPEEDHSEIVHLPLTDAVRLVERGEIVDAKTIIGLLLTERRLTEGDRGRA
jgi:8-oxo-dGTP pyrophosphatase MutT (NUDIX family)